MFLEKNEIIFQVIFQYFFKFIVFPELSKCSGGISVLKT